MKARTTATRVKVEEKEKILLLRLKIKTELFEYSRSQSKGVSWSHKFKGSEKFKPLKLKGLKRNNKYFLKKIHLTHWFMDPNNRERCWVLEHTVFSSSWLCWWELQQARADTQGWVKRTFCVCAGKIILWVLRREWAEYNHTVKLLLAFFVLASATLASERSTSSNIRDC